MLLTFEILGLARNDGKKFSKLSQTPLAESSIVTEFSPDTFRATLTKLLGYLQNIFPQGSYQNQFDGSD